MSETPRAQFWMVYGVAQREPTVRHENYDKAMREASRLARQSPGITFVVLEAVAAVVKNDLIVRRYRAPAAVSEPADFDQDIPF